MNTDNVRTFRVRSPLSMMGPAVLACVVAIVLLFFVMEADERWIILILLGVMVFSLGVVFWILTRTRLEISREGITYYAFGYLVRSSWQNVTGWGKRVQGSLDLDCLLLHEPGMEMSGCLSVGYQALPFMNAISLASGQGYTPNHIDRYGNVIPVGMFDKDWRSGEIGDLVRRYAPQVFEEQTD